jgi:Spy/CpxP family protein refolding chaperone
MSMQEGTRTRFATVLILLLVLATGSVMGVAIDRRIGAGGGSGAEETSEGSDSLSTQGDSVEGQSSGNQRRLMVEQVGLSDAQHAQVDSIVAEYRRRTRALHDELDDEIQAAYQPRYRVLLDEVREEIKGVLTPDQRMAYDSLLVDYDRRREERRRADSISDSKG